MRDTCRLCDSKNLELAVKVPPMPMVDGFTQLPNEYKKHNCDVYLCMDCGHAQLLEFLTAESMFTDYHFKTGDSPHLVEHFRQYATYCKKHFDTSFVVEIGSNDGTLLSMFEGNKLGVDPSNVPSSCEKITAFFTESLADEIIKDRGHATLVIANHVFAHADDLTGMLGGIRKLLASRGTFIFEVAYAQDMLDKGLIEQIEHEHLSYHSLEPLVSFLNRNGMELTNYSRNSCKGGSVRCEATHLDTGRVPNYTEDCSLGRYQSFAADIQRRREAVANLVNLVGYGAAAPCTSVMYQMGLQNRIFELVDDNASRHGFYSPCANIPVNSTSLLYETDAQVVILAPQYAQQIIAKHQSIKRRFIIP